MNKIYLAPMHGLADCVLRDVLTRIDGVHGYAGTVSEFIRVAGTRLPLRAFRRVCPELDSASRTFAGTPLIVQLLGSDPESLAENAAQLVSLHPAGVDLNFGCPAPTVNRHGGGASLLNNPEHLLRIVSAVRQVLPQHIPFSAKMRLGINDTSKTVACAQALAAGGITSLVVHARTRSEGYQPPAHWEWIAKIRESININVIANGEIWTPSDYQRCRAISGCRDVMIGRGAVADPFLLRRIKQSTCALAVDEKMPDQHRKQQEWLELQPLLGEFWRQVKSRVALVHAPGRLKLWLASLRRTFPEAELLYQHLRPLRSAQEIDAYIK